jgi:hypothetical protein
MIDKLSWMTIYPEVVLLIMTCVIALLDLASTSPRRTGTYILTLLTLAIVAVLTGFNASLGKTVYGFAGMVVSDPMGNWLKCFATRRADGHAGLWPARTRPTAACSAAARCSRSACCRCSACS